MVSKLNGKVDDCQLGLKMQENIRQEVEKIQTKLENMVSVCLAMKTIVKFV